jgi:hypothetical protein
MRIHFIENGVVVNTIEDESVEKVQAVFPDSQLFAFEGGGPGWLFQDGAIVPPPVPPMTDEERKAAIQAEIDRLEDVSRMNRGVRELALVTMSDLATRKAEMIKAANPDDPRTVEQIRNDELSTTPAYVKFKALDDQIAALRAQL